MHTLIDWLIDFRQEAPVELTGGEAEVAADYTKKKHVYRLKWVNIIKVF